MRRQHPRRASRTGRPDRVATAGLLLVPPFLTRDAPRASLPDRGRSAGGRTTVTTRVALVAAGAAAATLLVASPAAATFAPGGQLASVRGSELADGASTSPVISGDGRFVVFATSAPALLGAAPDGATYTAGVVRKDLTTGAVELVAPPQGVDADGAPLGNATIGGVAGLSHDGRYVLFATTAALAGGDPGSATPDVYVRDMTLPVGGPSYDLVSARDGEDRSASYATPTAGSVAGVPGAAISADGRRAVFVTTGASDLPAAPSTATPARQVWIRDLDARTTRLVSRRRDEASPAGVPAPAPAGAGSSTPVAAISADGRAVAWTAGDAELQTATLPGEGGLGPRPTLLWRTVQDLRAPARRVAGAADLDDPACAPGTTFVPSQTALGPCYGPFADGEGVDLNSTAESSLTLLGLSADGGRVLFTSSAARRPLDRAATRAGTGYLAEMGAGIPRKRAVTVAWSAPEATAGRDQIRSGRLAADGRHAVFASRDVRFDGLQPAGAFPSVLTPTYNLFSVDLDARSVERVTSGSDGSDYSTGLADQAPDPLITLSADGSAVALSAADGNLFIGDANGLRDVIVARRRPATTSVADRVPPPAVEPAGPGIAASTARPLVPRFAVGLAALRVAKRTGTATIRVELPAAGTLRAVAAGRATRVVRSGGRTRRVPVAATVGRVTRKVGRATRFTLTVKVGAQARKALRRSPYRLAVRLTLRFTPVGAPTSSVTRTYALRRSHVTATKARPRTATAARTPIRTGAAR